jgi:group II intron reverse transcriptase/maturase
MQKAKLILTMLNRKSKSNLTFKFDRLYRNLFNPDFYLNAYAKIYRKEGNLTKGVDGKTIDGFSVNVVNTFIQEMKFERYMPYPVRRTYIPKKDKTKLRPLGIPTVNDKLIQEAVRQILEAIYEPLFDSSSHGFRPHKSCQTALHQIKLKGSGCAWVIEGDIKGFFDNIDHETLIEILKLKIKDGRFLNLIKRFLKAGIMEEGKIKDSISGTPQGGIISPILANIYLNELDKYMDTVSKENEIGERRKNYLPHHRLICNRYNLIRKGKYKEAKELLKKAQKMQAVDSMDPNFRRIKYVRYADDFVVLINGSKAIAEQIKMDIAKFLKEKLKLELNMDKTIISNTLKDKIKFLGYEFCKAKDDTKITKAVDGVKYRSVNGNIQLLVPAKVINEKIKRYTRNGKPIHLNERVNSTIISNITQYNAEIRGLYNYYCLANNVSKQIAKFQFYHYYSLVKTIACKHKLSVRSTIRKYGISVKRKQGTGTRKIIGIKYKTKNGEKTLTYFNESLKHADRPLSYNITSGETVKDYKNELIARLFSGKCELCGKHKEIENMKVHHVRKLKNVKEKYRNKKTIPNWIKIMIKMNRKTLVVCEECFNKVY